MLNTRRILIAFASVSLMCGVASANSLTETFTLSGTATSPTLTDFSGLLSAPQFNSSIAVLQSVEIDITSNMSTDLQIINNDTSNSSGTAHTQLQIYVQDAGNMLNGGTFSTGAGTLAYCAGLGGGNPGCIGGYSYSIGGGTSKDSGAITSSATQDYTYVLNTILSEFTGAGNITLHTNTLTGTVLANTGGNTNAFQTTFANVTGQVIYTYNSSAPEPATLFLMGSALVGVGVLRKRFKA
jgi:hypothetical protein